MVHYWNWHKESTTANDWTKNKFSDVTKLFFDLRGYTPTMKPLYHPIDNRKMLISTQRLGLPFDLNIILIQTRTQPDQVSIIGRRHYWNWSVFWISL